VSTRTALLAALLCLAPIRPQPAAAPSVLVPLVTLSGAQSHVSEERCVRITTQEEWAALWLEHLGHPAKPKYDIYFNKAGLPVVDFEHCMVVAVFGGEGSNCAGVSAVAGALEDPDAETLTPVANGEEVLRLSWHSYQSSDRADPVCTFGFFVLPRSSAPLVVQDRSMRRGGGRGQLVERARLPAPATPGG
jgi:hypothetical protein